MTKELWAGFADDEDVVWIGHDEHGDHAMTVGELRRAPELARKILAPLSARVRGMGALLRAVEEEKRIMRGNGGRAHGQSVRSKSRAAKDERWLTLVLGLLTANPTLSDNGIADNIIDKKKKADRSEERTLRGYIAVVRAEQRDSGQHA